jgi:hypothetical protein
LDGYEPSIDFIHVDLKPPQSIKILYGRKKAIAQRKGKRELYEKYVRRERNREKDSINKRNARTPWKRIYRRMSEVALTAYVDPSNTSRESLDAGMLWRPKRGRS